MSWPSRFLNACSVFACAVALLTLACGGGKASAPTASPPPAATAVPEPADPAQGLIGSRTQPDALPNATSLLAGGEPVAFKVCSRTTGWTRPSPQEMAPAFTNPRFGDGKQPYPLNYALYLERFYYVTAPNANSANIEWGAMSGFGVNPGQELGLCAEPDISALVAQFAAPAKSSLPFFQDLQLVDYRALDMKRQGPNLVVEVEAAPETHEVAYFPYPADPAFFDSSAGFESLQVVDSAGHLLYAESRVPFVSWFERLSYDAAGQLEVAVLAGDSPILSTDLHVPPGQAPLTLYWGLGLPLRAAPAGKLTALDAAGSVLLEVSWPADATIWQPLASLRLPPETSGLRIETSGGATDTSYRHFVLLREGLPLPLPADPR